MTVAAHERSGPRRWLPALARSALALWIPSLVAIASNHQVRRSWEDAWFWPGAVPGRYFIEEFYGASFAFSALGALIAWTVVVRRWPGLGLVGALLHGTVSALYVCAVAAI